MSIDPPSASSIARRRNLYSVATIITSGINHSHRSLADRIMAAGRPAAVDTAVDGGTLRSELVTTPVATGARTAVPLGGGIVDGGPLGAAKADASVVGVLGRWSVRVAATESQVNGSSARFGIGAVAGCSIASTAESPTGDSSVTEGSARRRRRRRKAPTKVPMARPMGTASTSATTAMSVAAEMPTAASTMRMANASRERPRATSALPAGTPAPKPAANVAHETTASADTASFWSVNSSVSGVRSAKATTPYAAAAAPTLLRPRCRDRRS